MIETPQLLDRWSIGIYTGDSPLRLAAAPQVDNPVLCRHDVTDVTARFVADPFMVTVGGIWHMFFEVVNETVDRGQIGHAVSGDGLRWEYDRIVLAEPFHLSFPYVFEWESEYFMIPETLGAGAVQLYRAEAFPERWRPVATLVEGRLADPAVFRCDGLWWLLACSEPFRHNALSLFFAERLEGPWREHPMSPIVQADATRARPAGRVMPYNGGLLRFAQDCVPIYGWQTRAFWIEELTSLGYRESEAKESPVLCPAAGSRWNRRGMHHCDPHPSPTGGWIACVDGRGTFREPASGTHAEG